MINQILDSEPTIDLVVLNGDLITGENTFRENSTQYLDQIVEPIIRRNLTWASTYGNHDSSYNISRDDLYACESSLWPRNSRTKSMVPRPETAGVTNYYLPVYAKPGCAEETCIPAMILWFFDSRGGHKFQQSTTQPDGSTAWVGQQDWVDESVVSWFQETNSTLQSQLNSSTDNSDHKQKVIPSLAFVHIPINASLTLQKQGIDPSKEPGINHDKPLAQQGKGWCADGKDDGKRCSYGGQDVPFMRALASTPGLVALFSGHDHGNTWCGHWDGTIPGDTAVGTARGLNLCFGQHTGYGGYGSWIRGGRQVLVTLEGLAKKGGEDEENLKDFDVETYIRLENGDIVGAVTLNGTYGQDVYPVTPDQRTYVDPSRQPETE